ncbi:MAG: ATP-binding protein [Candidatus Aenigmatarchaeota archaeon]
MQNYIGTVISTEDTPNIYEFKFIITSNVKAGQYISVNTNEGEYIGKIKNIIKISPYFQNPDAVKEIEKTGSSISEVFPSDNWEYLIGDVEVIGLFNNGNISKAYFPVTPGAKVYIAKNYILEKIFGFDLENGLNLGKIEHHNLDVKINMSKLLKKHLAVLAMSGAGKSYFTSVLIEELLDKKENEQPAIILIDPHGEYSGFNDDLNYRKKVNLIKGKDFKISVPTLNAEFLIDLMPDPSSVQKRELRRIFSIVKEKYRNTAYNLDKIIEELNNDEEIKSDTKNILLNFLEDLNDTGIFAEFDNPSLEKITRQGHLTIIDISDITELREKRIIVAILAKKLFLARRANIIPPFLFIVEEAHNFAPQQVKKENAISKNIIEKIAREGRKFYACLCLISQRPVHLSTTAISQCNTHVLLRITNPYDIQHIQESCEGITGESVKILPSLKVGEAIIVGEAVNFPIQLKVREMKSKFRKSDVSLEEACKKFACEKLKFEEDAKAFF